MKCPTCNNGKVVCDGQVIDCPTCKGDGIAPTPRVNCSGCGTPHPAHETAHETARGMCVRCLGIEVERLKNRVCEWRETGTWWASRGCDPHPQSITLMRQTYCPGCVGRIKIKFDAKG